MEPAFSASKENCPNKLITVVGQRMHGMRRVNPQFARCTEELTESIPWLGEAFKDIENFAAGNMNCIMHHLMVMLEMMVWLLLLVQQHLQACLEAAALHNIHPLFRDTWLPRESQEK